MCIYLCIYIYLYHCCILYLHGSIWWIGSNRRPPICNDDNDDNNDDDNDGDNDSDNGDDDDNDDNDVFMKAFDE
jgi:hypothetical protein